MGDEDNDDNLEQAEAIPKEIPHESSYSMAIRKKRVPSEDSDRAEFGDADTERIDFVQGVGTLAVASKVPTQLIFTLRNIKSLNARCFFCKELECDQVFMSKSLAPGKTRAYAAHSACVFDHLQLQDLPSGGL